MSEGKRDRSEAVAPTSSLLASTEQNVGKMTGHLHGRSEVNDLHLVGQCFPIADLLMSRIIFSATQMLNPVKGNKYISSAVIFSCLQFEEATFVPLCDRGATLQL